MVREQNSYKSERKRNRIRLEIADQKWVFFPPKTINTEIDISRNYIISHIVFFFVRCFHALFNNKSSLFLRCKISIMRIEYQRIRLNNKHHLRLLHFSFILNDDTNNTWFTTSIELTLNLWLIKIKKISFSIIHFRIAKMIYILKYKTTGQWSLPYTSLWITLSQTFFTYRSETMK